MGIDSSTGAVHLSLDEEMRKRARVPNSCTVCRKRKVKCDKAKPACGQCTKRNTVDTCTYEEFPWRVLSQEAVPDVSRQELMKIVSSLRNIETALKGSDTSLFTTLGDSTRPSRSLTRPYNPSEQVQIYDYMPFIVPFILRKCRIEHYGALSPAYSIKQDPHLRILWLYTWSSFEKNMGNYTGFIASSSAISNQPSESSGQHVSKDLSILLSQYRFMRQKKATQKIECRTIKDTKASLAELVTPLLPPRWAVKELCNIYFDRMHAICPILDRKMFMENQLPHLIGPWDGPDQIQVIIPPAKSNTPLAYPDIVLCELLVVVGLTNMCIQQDQYESVPHLKLMRNYNTGIFQAIAKRCIDNNYNMTRKPYSLCLIQLLVLLKYYNHFCPEDDDVSDQSEGRILMGTIYSLAMTMGLHIDPATTALTWGSGSHFPVYERLARRIWHHILHMDAMTAATVGALPLCQSEDIYNTDLPNPGNSTESEVEKMIDESYISSDRLVKLFRKICLICFAKGDPPLVSDMFNVITELKHYLETIPSIEDIVMSPYSICWKMKGLNDLFSVYSLLLGLQSRLMGHFQKKNDTRMVYTTCADGLKVSVTMIDMVLNICYNINTYFSNMCSIFLRSLVFPVMSRSLALLGSLLGKASHLFTTFQSVGMTSAGLKTVRILQDLYDTVLIQIERGVHVTKLVNEGYYNSARHVVGMTYFLEIMKDPSFNFKKATEMSKQAPQGVNYISSESEAQNNFLMGLLDHEIEHLTAIMQTDIQEVITSIKSPASEVSTASTIPIANPSLGYAQQKYHAPSPPLSNTPPQIAPVSATFDPASPVVQPDLQSLFEGNNPYWIRDLIPRSADKSGIHEAQGLVSNGAIPVDPATFTTDDILGLFNDDLDWLDNQAGADMHMHYETELS
ncbi:Heme-responsive zinc finger transcription factor HAP1 [Cyberlindnera fabianii]|uniref:Heme-responsive zinc finger transcription factor HAP1 n=1 Tax=Cyberlindnera fabianii TaxID=36022 RepID=A0A1V2LD49_CYBFA|nr:Heme-responsive zinc finger transcription factor HAP1 [Cyberlindnera fabianii]